jgi:RimJ/RimL family protein N-acetyltransferase
MSGAGEAVEFDFQPILTGERVVIRPVVISDWVSMFEVASDPKIWELHPEHDRYTEAVFRQYFENALECGSGFAFVHRESGRIFGSSRYHGLDIVSSEIEIGWTFLSRDYWGGSFNLEIKRLMLDHAFRFVDTVVFWVGEENLRSRRAMEKIGGVLREGICRRDASRDHRDVVYEIRKKDWQEP